MSPTPLTVDRRTRFEGDDVPLDPSDFLATLEPTTTDASAAAYSMSRLGLPPLTLVVDGAPLTIDVSDGRLAASPRATTDLVLTLDRGAFSDLMQGVVSTFGVQMTGRAEVTAGQVDHLIAWEPVLRTFLDGRPVYEPGTIDFRSRDGDELDLRHSFALDDDPAAIGHFLAEAGFLHIQGVFTEAEMAAVSRDLDEAMAAVERDDGESWWARTEDEGWYPARILGFSRRSPALHELLTSDRFARLGTFTDDQMVQLDPDGPDSAEGLHKKVGVVEGASDVSWHKDCSMGNHSRRCCRLTVGISVTGAGPTNGELGVVAGSHRANVPALGIGDLDLPRLALPTRTGDVTVHCSCTLHMSRPPVSAERRVVYTSFELAPRPGDRFAVEPDEDQLLRDRAALNDHVRRRQRTATGPSARTASFEL